MKKCFLASPSGMFGSEVHRHAAILKEYVVEPACLELGYELSPVDEGAEFGVITQRILRLLLDADVVIADITNLNPNVMYELGVRHTTGKPTIVMALQGQTIPFDIASYRTLMYSLNDPSDAKRARRALLEMLTAAQDNRRLESPITDVIKQEAGETLKTQETLSYDYGPLLRSMSERLGSLDEKVKEIGKQAASKETVIEYTRDVFVVHGHDGELKNELARFLEKLEFRPIILHEQPDRGQTIIQKLQYEASRVGYAFILHTPDDEGRKKESESTLNARSRQNVVFEHGMFVGQFSPNRVCAIVREGVEFPSDLSGVIYKSVPKGGGISSIAFELIGELKAAGYVVDANKVA